LSLSMDSTAASHPLSWWDVESNSWQIAAGDYAVYVGNSSRNLTRAGTFHVGS
jgi:beta-glucosidase